MLRRLSYLHGFIFVLSLVIAEIAATIVWNTYVDGQLYHCTDEVGLDFIFPGNWVHGDYIYVPDVMVSRTMSDPDTIKIGWSFAKLWGLWFCFAAVAVTISLFVTVLISWLVNRVHAYDWR